MIVVDLFKKRTKLHGTSYRDRAIYKMQNRINRYAKYNPSYKEVEIDGNKRYINIYSTENKDTKHFACMPDEYIERGEIIKWYGTWMVTSTDADEDVYQSGIMKRCNYELKWMNKNADIITRPSILSFPYSSLIKDNKVYTTDKTKCQIFVSFDSETSMIRADDRFFISGSKDNHTVYRVDNVNDVENTFNGEGYIVLTMSQTMLNTDTDNTELRICDYYKIKDEAKHSGESESSGSNEQSEKYCKIESDVDYIIPEYVGTSIKAHFFNGELEVNDVKPHWNIESDNNELLNITYSDDKKEMTIETDSDEMLGKHVKITLSDDNNEYKNTSLSLLVRGM